MLTRIESTPTASGVAVYSIPYALDLTAWWPVIDREGWHVGLTMTLLERLSDAIYGKLPPESSEAGPDV